MSDEMLTKVTLDGDKEVILRTLQVKHYKLAAEAAAHKAKNNQTLLSLYMQDEILKLLIVAVDGKKLSGVDKERVENLFDNNQYRQLMMVVEEMVGEAKRPKVELVPQSSLSGDKSLGSAGTPA